MTPNNFRVKNGLTVGTTISGGNTTITGFVNASSTVNAAGLAVGTAFVANTTQVVFGTSTGLNANGGIGTAGQVLHSNGTSIYWAADDNAGGTVTSIATANGISGGTITTTGTIGVTTGSTLTVNSTGIHVNSALSIGDLILSGNLTVSGTRTYVNTTTLDVGDNIITLNADLGASAPSQDAGIEIMRGTSANVQFMWDETNDRWSTNSQPLAISSLIAAGALSGVTTAAMGNTTITGFASVASARGGVAAPTLGQQNSSLYVTNSDTNYGLLFGVDPATGRGWIQTQRVDGTATAYALRLNPSGGTTEFGAGYNETEVSNTAATGTFTMNCSNANFFDLTLTGNITISPSNVPANGRVWSGSIAAKQDATGGRTITWPTGTKYAGGVAPPATTTANALDIWSLMTYDGGTSWIVSLSVKNAA